MGLDRFRIGRATRTKCDVCGGANWRTFAKEIDGEPSRLVLGATWSDGAPVEDYGLPVLALACIHCGNIRLMAADLPSLLYADGDLETEPHD